MTETTPPPAPSHETGRSLGSLTLSVLIHAAILGLLAAFTLTARPSRDVEAVVSLGPQTLDADASAVPAAGRMGRDAELRAADPVADAAQAVASMPMPASQAATSPPTPAPADPALQAQAFASSDPAMAMLAAAAGGAPGDRAVPAGAGVLDGTSDAFQKMVRGLRARGLDVVFVLDATDSMAPYIEQAKERINQIMSVITGVVDVDESGRNAGRTRFGVVVFKDYGDEYGLSATRQLALTEDAEAVQQFIDGVRAGGGGDVPEPIHKALAVATSRNDMQWRAGRQSIIILVGDAPVHTSGRKAAVELAGQFARAMRGQVNTIDVGADRRQVLPDFADIARAGKGSAFQLREADRFWQHLIVTVFGKEYEQDVDYLVKRLAGQD